MKNQGEVNRPQWASRGLLGQATGRAALAALAIACTGGALFGSGYQDSAASDSEAEKIAAMRENQGLFIELRTQISKEKAQLEETKQFLEDRTDLIKAEIETMREAIAKQATKVESSTAVLAKMVEERDELKAGTASLEALIGGLEARILKLIPRLPLPSRDGTVTQLALGIPGNEAAKSDAEKAAEAAAAEDGAAEDGAAEDGAAEDGAAEDGAAEDGAAEPGAGEAGAEGSGDGNAGAATEGDSTEEATSADKAKDVPSLFNRFIQVVGIMNAVDKFNTDVEVVKESHLLPNGKNAEVPVIYIGLSQAFFAKAASSDGSTAAYAARGIPTEEGFIWQPVPENAGDILRVINIYGGSDQAAFVKLPTVID